MKIAEERTTLFVKSNIGTNMATSVPKRATVGDLKEILAREHFHCFPDAGARTVRNLMVKKKGVFYTLSNSTNINSVFLGESRGCLLFMDMCPMKSTSVDMPFARAPSTGLICKPCLGAAETIAGPCVEGKGRISKDGSTMEDCLELGKTCLGQTAARSVSANMSVTAIISMYFMEVGEEVNSSSGGCQRRDMIASDKSQHGIDPQLAEFSCADTSYKKECNPQQYNNKDGLLHDKGHFSFRTDAGNEERSNNKADKMVSEASQASRKPSPEVILLQSFSDPSVKIPKMRNRRRDMGTPLCRAANNIQNEITSANKRLALPPISVVTSRIKKYPARSSGYRVFDISESES